MSVLAGDAFRCGKGRFMVESPEGPGAARVGPRTSLLVRGTSHAEAALAHAFQAYAGAARLLVLRGRDDPLPWSSMVLLRTAFEASLRVNHLLSRNIDPDRRLLRMVATALDAEDSSAKLDKAVPRVVAARLVPASDRRSALDELCVECGITVERGQRGGGSVLLDGGLREALSFNMVAASTQWWPDRGEHTWRWLCSFTHASNMGRSTKRNVAALDCESIFVVFLYVTEALWGASDEYASWAGFPNGRVRRRFSKVKRLCTQKLGHAPTPRPTGDPGLDSIFEAIAAAGATELHRELRRDI